ncbi:MAG: hypothetical protein WDA42_06870 [Candidatus Bathyarchaeia archaeon]
MKKAIVTTSFPGAVANKQTGVEEITQAYLADYAKKVNADFIISKNLQDYNELSLLPNTEEQANARLIGVCRWVINARVNAFRTLVKDGYDQILFLDKNVLILEHAEDIFTYAPTKVAAFNEGRFVDAHGKLNAGQSLKAMHTYALQKNRERVFFGLPEIKITQDYYNTGVYLLSAASGLCNPPAIYFSSPMFDQDHWNWELYEKDVSPTSLPRSFNHMLWEKFEDTLSYKPFFLHYAGIPYEYDLLTMLKKHITLLSEEGLIDASKAFKSVSPNAILE